LRSSSTRDSAAARVAAVRRGEVYASCGESVARAKKRTVGNPFDKNTSRGAGGSDQFNKVMSYIDAGKKEKAKLVTGGQPRGR